MKKNIIVLNCLACLLFLFLGSTAAFSQIKKNIDFYELDVNHGLFFQPNTMDPYTGTAHEEYGDGSKKRRIPIKNGKVHGKVEDWAMNGKKVAEMTFIEGKQQGKELQWYESELKKQQQKLEAIYVDGKVEGVVTEWYDNGQKKSEGYFSDNKESGEHWWWHINGRKDQLITYENGKANGLVKHWHFNTQLKLEGQFKNGVEHGPFQEWHPNGELKMEGTYTEGKEDGIFNAYSKKGIILGQQTFVNGKLTEDLNYRNGNINRPGGYTQVFNEKESFFTVDINAKTVYPRSSTDDIIYVVDRQFLQLLNYPIELFEKQPTDKVSEVELLKKFVSFESEYITKKTGQPLNVEIKEQTNAGGKTFIHWYFKVPRKANELETPRTVKEEHYVSMLCKQQVLSLYSLVTKVNNPADVQKMLYDIADTVKIYDERIELNALNKKLHRMKH